MSAYSEFFLNSKSSVVQLELVEISHPNFTKVYRVVRNAVQGVTVKLETGANATFEYYPLRIENNGDVAIDWGHVIFKGLHIKGIYGCEMFETWYKMAAMLKSGLDISPVISHRFPVGDFREAFEIMRSGQSGKVILDWTA